MEAKMLIRRNNYFFLLCAILLTTSGCAPKYSGPTDIKNLYLRVKNSSFDKYFSAYQELIDLGQIKTVPLNRVNLIEGKVQWGASGQGVKVTLDATNQFLRLDLDGGSGSTIREFASFYPEGKPPILAVTAKDSKAVAQPILADLQFFQANDGEWPIVTSKIFPAVSLDTFGLLATPAGRKLSAGVFVACHLPRVGTTIKCEIDFDYEGWLALAEPGQDLNGEAYERTRGEASAILDALPKKSLLFKWDKKKGIFTQSN
jgi:hypothetical protein